MAETRKLKYDEAALRTLTREDLDALEIGAGILGTGGGGTMEETEASMHARRAIDRALSLLTPARGRVVCAVCGMDEAPGTRIRTLHAALDILHERW